MQLSSKIVNKPKKTHFVNSWDDTQHLLGFILTPHQNGQINPVPVLLQNIKVTLQQLIASIQHHTIVEPRDARVVAVVDKVVAQTEHTLPCDQQLRGIRLRRRREIEFAIVLVDFFKFTADFVVR